jgi:hypothetical protein
MGEKTRDEFGVGEATSQHSENIQATHQPDTHLTPRSKHAHLATLSVQFTVTQRYPKTKSRWVHGTFARGISLPGSLRRKRKAGKLRRLSVKASKA